MPIDSYITATPLQLCLMSPSKISYPPGLRIKMNYIKKRAFIQRLPETPYKIEDFLSKLYLSIQ